MWRRLPQPDLACVSTVGEQSMAADRGVKPYYTAAPEVQSGREGCRPGSRAAGGDAAQLQSGRAGWLRGKCPHMSTRDRREPGRVRGPTVCPQTSTAD